MQKSTPQSLVSEIVVVAIIGLQILARNGLSRKRRSANYSCIGGPSNKIISSAYAKAPAKQLPYKIT